jgi:hypothetical protein
MLQERAAKQAHKNAALAARRTHSLLHPRERAPPRHHSCTRHAQLLVQTANERRSRAQLVPHAAGAHLQGAGRPCDHSLQEHAGGPAVRVYGDLWLRFVCCFAGEVWGWGSALGGGDRSGQRWKRSMCFGDGLVMWWATRSSFHRLDEPGGLLKVPSSCPLKARAPPPSTQSPPSQLHRQRKVNVSLFGSPGWGNGVTGQAAGGRVPSATRQSTPRRGSPMGAIPSPPPCTPVVTEWFRPCSPAAASS